MTDVLSGMVDDTDILQNERVVDMSERFTLLDSEFSQFTTMLMKIGSEETHSTKVEWISRRLSPILRAASPFAAQAA